MPPKHICFINSSITAPALSPLCLLSALHCSRTPWCCGSPASRSVWASVTSCLTLTQWETTASMFLFVIETQAYHILYHRYYNKCYDIQHIYFSKHTNVVRPLQAQQRSMMEEITAGAERQPAVWTAGVNRDEPGHWQTEHTFDDATIKYMTNTARLRQKQLFGHIITVLTILTVPTSWRTGLWFGPVTVPEHWNDLTS